MGSDETAITIPGGPRVIDVLTGDEAPSGPNNLLFSDDQGAFGRYLDDRGARGKEVRSLHPLAGVDLAVVVAVLALERLGRGPDEERGRRADDDERDDPAEAALGEEPGVDALTAFKQPVWKSKFMARSR